MTNNINPPLLLDAITVRHYHSVILLPGQLDGESDTRTTEAVLTRVKNQIHYGDIHDDVIEVASAFAVAITLDHYERLDMSIKPPHVSCLGAAAVLNFRKIDAH